VISATHVFRYDVNYLQPLSVAQRLRIFVRAEGRSPPFGGLFPAVWSAVSPVTI
jgi:hypothetical protein